MAEGEKRLNWRQTCELLGCGKRKFYHMVKTGQLQAWRLGDSKRGLWVWEKDLEKLMRRVEAQTCE